MPSLKQILPSSSTVTVTFGDVALRVTYKPSAVTPRLQKSVAAARATGDLDAGLLDPFVAIVQAWDLTDDDGSPVPITRDGLGDVPGAVLLAVLVAIGGDMAPNPTSGDESSNGSHPTASSAPLASPNGISS